MSTTNTQKILFIDSAVGDISSILASVDPSFEVVLLSSDRNGLEQIADALAGRTGVDAVHVISHGGSGYLQLGDSTLDLSGLDSQSDALATISGALSESADLLLYGCDVAAGEAGANFINALAAATGADVAASVDPTGPTSLGGDSLLESSTGDIDAPALNLDTLTQTLAAPGNAGFEDNLTSWSINDTAVGTGGNYAAGSNTWTVNPYGSKMAVLTPAGGSGEKSAAFAALGINSASQTYLNNQFSSMAPTNYAYMTTSVVLAAGETFTMAWNYVSTDYEPWNDGSVASFVNTSVPSDQSMTIQPGSTAGASGGQVVILGATNKGTGNYSTGSYGSTGWQQITFTAGQAGTYTVGFTVFNLGDTAYNPYLFVDQAQGTTQKNGTNFGPIAPDNNPPPPPVTNAAPVFSATTHTNGSTFTDTAADDSFAALTGKVNASDANSDTLTFAVSGATSGTTVKTGVYGTFTLTDAATGTFSYTPNDAAIEGRKTGITESFTVTVSDGKGGSASTTVTFTIGGANDTTVFAGTTSGAVAEDGATSASGTVSATDRDTGDATLLASAATSIYGTFIVNAAGQWSYALNNGNTAVQSLTQGQTVNDTFYVSTAGGASQAVTVTITGQNDRPTLSSNAALLAQAEDSLDGSATSIATLLGGRFADVDSGASFAGVLVAGNAATGAQGVWQYQLSGSGAWVDIPAIGLSSSNALALSASTLVRFVPAPDYNGTPGSLSVYAADNVYAGGFSTGTQVFSNVSAGGISTAGRAVSITITPANDAPVFTGSDLSIGLTEGAGADSTGALQAAAAAADPVVALTGTVAATDVDNASNTLTYSIQGGQSGIDAESGLIVVQGSYGRLTLDPTSGDWTYSPTNTAAINALEAGEVGVETFSFKVSDGAGASDTKSLTVSITGTDDTPVLASALADTTVTGDQWTYQLPVGSFTDAEGEALVYSAQLVDADGVLVGDGSLPAGLSFDAATRTFTGNGLAHNGQQLYLKVTASDGSAAVSDVFRLTVANQAPTSGDDSVSFAEDQVRVLSLADFGPYADADGDDLSSVTITVLPAQGALEFNDGNGWAAVTQDQSVSASDIAAGHLRFVPVAQESGNAYATLQFQVSDGTDLSAAHTLTLNVTSVAEAPALTGTPHSFASATEDTPFTVTTAELLQGFTDVDPGQTATLAIDALSVSNAQVVDNGDGTWTVTPYANLSGGALTLRYTVVDTDGLTASRSVGVSVGGSNDTPPTRTGDAAVLAAGNEDQAYTVTLAQLKQGFSDVEGNMGVWGLTADHGSVSTSDGGLTYTITPTANYNGPVTLSYNVDDGQSATGTSIVFTLNPVNDAPTGTASATLAAATEDQSHLLSAQDLLQGFSDVENDALSVVGNSLVATKASDGTSAGTITDNGDGTWTFNPVADFNGTVNLTYSVSDGALTRAATNTFQVTDVSDQVAQAPGLGGDAVDAVLANQWSKVFTGDDPVSGTSGVNRVTVQTSSGTLRLPADVAATTGVTIITQGYGSATDGSSSAIAFEGTESQINDALALLEISTGSAATVTVALTQDKMIYNPDTGHFYEIGGTAGVGISWTAAKAAAEGSTYNGMQGYLATITSSNENAYILSKLPATGWIGASDSQTEGTWKWVTGPEAGTLLSSGYTNWNPGEPNNSGDEDYAQFYVGGGNAGQWNDLPNSVGTTVQYYVIEYGGQGETPTNNVVSSFNVAVEPSNTAPTASDLTQSLTAAEDSGAVALGDIVVTDADASAVITATLTLSHPLSGALSTDGVYTMTYDAGSGVWTGTAGAATLTYNPNTGVWVAKGSVADVNAALAAVNYLPNANSVQDVTITTLIRDQLNTGPASGTISIDITPVNDLPTSTNDSVTAREDTALALTLADFGQYADAESTVFSSVKVTVLPAAGTLELSDGSTWSAVVEDQVITAADIAAGRLRFVPEAGENGNAYATVGFLVGDGTDFSAAPYTLTVNVSSVNDAPSGSATTVFSAVNEDTARTISMADLLAGFGDTDGGTLAVAGLSADHASVVNNGNGSWTIKPYANYNGTITLSYSVIDGQGGSVAASNTYEVTPVNDAPALTSAPTALGAATQDTPKSITSTVLLGGYTDPDGTTPSIKDNSVTADHGATVSYDSGTGTYTVTPAPGYSGPITLSYTVTDGTAELAITRVLEVSPVNDAPVVGTALADQAATENQPFGFAFSPSAFADPEHATLTYSVALVDGDGNLINGGALPAWLDFDAQTREFSGTPPLDAAGSYAIRVTASDGSLSTQDTFVITVADANQAPTVDGALADQTLAQVQTGIDLSQVFTDADGGAPTLTPTLANGDPLPSWLVWNAGTQTLSGNPPGGQAYVDIKVVAEDSSSGTAETTFRINLTDAGQTPNTMIGTLAANNAGAVSVAAGGGSDPYPLGTVLTATVSDTDGFNSANVVYQWQVSADGSSWSDIAGATAATFTLAQAQSDQQVRVQAFYNDNGSVLEMPVSTAVGVALTDQAGAVTVSGSPAAGQTLQATLTDPDGLLGATPVYTWQTSANGSTGWTQVATGASNAYTLTNNDGGQYVRVVVTYVDDADTPVRSVTGALSSSGSPVMVQLGAVSPVPVDQTASAVEAGGVADAIAGSNPEGNLLTGATDANAGDVISFDSVRTGSALGLGAPALPDPESAGDVVLQGTYGQLRVSTATGAYSYTVDNASTSVQALYAGQQVTDSFNYSLKDATDLTGSALLTFTVTGADDAPAGTGLTASASVTEDVATAVDLSGLALSDFDGAVGEVYALSVSAGTAGAVLAAASTGGVVVTGSGTGTITFTGTLPNLNAFIDNAGALTYTSLLNDDTADTLAVQLHYGVGQANSVSLGSVAVDITPINDVPTLDLDADNSSGATGTGYLTSFQPRSGVPVAVVDSDMAIADVDTTGGLSDTIGLATILVAEGALDNTAQNLEKLTSVGDNVLTVDGEVRFTFDGYDAADASTYLVVAGNGTGKVTFLGEGTHAQYEAALKSVVYENISPFASGGTRTITVTVTDNATTGGDPLSVTASTTLLQPWTPVVDLNGDGADVFDRDHVVTFTEDGAPVAIATSDASLTDLDSNIQQVVVSLRTGDAGAPVGAEDELIISPALVSLLAAAPYNITTVVSGDKHTVTFTGNNTSSVFQLALRSVQYQNTSESPTVPLTRCVDVTTLDVNSHVGVPATTTITVVPVNDAPLAVQDTASADEAGGVLNAAAGVDPTGNVLTNDTDPDTAGANADTQAVQSARVGASGDFTAVAVGSSSADGGTVLVGQYGTLTIGANGSYVYEVDNGNTTVQALDDGSVALTDVFSYTLVDSGSATSVATLVVSIAGSNDAPVVTVQAGADDSAAEGVTEADAALATSGTLSVEDVDTADSVTVAVSAVVASGVTTGLQSDNAALLAMMTVDASAVIDATQTTGSIHWGFASAADAFDHLAEGQTLTLTYTLTVNDGTTTNTHDVVVTVTGTNDVPEIGGVHASDATEDTAVASDLIGTQGQLTIADADHGQSNFAAQASYAGTYGSFTLAADGSWTYSADNTQVAIQQLGDGESLTDSFTATSSDGTASQLVTVTINGSNDLPTIGGVHTSSVTEDADVTDGLLSTQGQLTIDDTDQGQANFAAQASFAGTYGTFTLAVDGTWTYSADNTQAAIQQLAVGESLTDSFTAASSDGSASQIVTVTIEGTNDTPVITVGGDDSVSASITETNALVSASGTLTVTDVDANDTVLASVDAVSVAGSFDGVNPLDNADLLAMLSLTTGAIAANAADAQNLAWSFNSGSAAAFDFLPAGETLELTYTVQVADSADPALTTSQDVTITITGTDDKPVIDISGADVAGIDGEVIFKPRGDGVALFGTDLSVSDVDDAELLTGATLVLDSATALDNAFGSTFETLYAASTADATVSGGTITVGSTVLSLSGNGTAASPLVITGTATAAEYKTALQTLHYANTNPNAFAGDRTVSVTVRDDGVAPANADKLLSDVAELTVSVNWTPVLDLNGALTGRNYSASYVEKQSTTTYVAAPTATLFDQNGLIQNLTITLQNAPDGTSETLSISAATIAVLQSNGIKAEVIVTDGASHQVVLSAWDFTNGVPYTDGRSTSAFQIGLRGVAYSNASAAPDEDTARTVLVSALDVDGSPGVSAVTTINVTGVNIPPVLADVSTDGDVTETDQSSAFTAGNLSGTLVATDEDLQALTFGIATGSGAYVAVDALETSVTIDAVSYQVSLDGAYGTLYVNATTGQYVYVPDADLVNTIADGDTQTETFTVFATDGESDLVVKTYTIELTGADDAPTLVSVTASITEDDLSGTTTDVAITGTLAGADVDDGAVLSYGITGGTVDLLAGTVSLALAYGTLVVNTSTGQYAYTQDAAAVEALAVTETDADLFTITVSDGTGALVTNTLTVTVSGANDAPVAAVAVDTATEDGAVTTGSVSSSDVDVLGTTASYALDAAVAGLTLNANGSYSFNPGHAAYQYLAAGETLDVVADFTVTDDQGATHGSTLTITVTGTNDAPVAAVAVDTATEDGALVTGSVSSSDVDVLGATASYALDAAVAGLTLNANGSYSFNPGHAAYQYLAAGETLDVVADFTVTDDQGATHGSTLTFTVTGTNDAPVAAVAVDTATEDGAVITGSVSSSDVDVLGTTASYALDAAVAGLTLNANGSYSFNPGHAAYQYLAAGETLGVVADFTVTDDQGATHGSTLTITVTGTNDAPVAVVAVDTATEDGALVTGSVSSSDVDVLGTTASYALDAAVAGLTLNANGSYSFNPDHAAYQYLAAGETLDVVADFTVTDDQGATHGSTLTFTVTGTNDTPVAAVQAGAAVERSGLDNAVAGQDATGNVLSGSTDVDSTDTHVTVEVQAITGAGTATAVPPSSTSALGYVAVQGLYGSLQIGADGSYRYLVHDDDATVQALRSSTDTLEDVFSYTLADGSGATAASTLTITVAGANDAPTLVRVSNLAVTELTGATPNTPSAVNVGALTTDDPDDGDSFVYDIIGGAQQFYFQIGSVDGVPTLQLRQGVPLNAEFLSEYSVVVRSTDTLGLSTFETFVVNVNDVNEFGVTAPTFNVLPMAGGLDPNTVPENTAVGAFTGVTASATDADATNHTVTYTLVGSAFGASYTAGEFQIDPVDGKVYVAGPIDREAGGGSRTLYVQATSSDGSSSIRSLNLFISDVNEHAVSAPVDASGTANLVAENAPVGLNVGITASASDADATTNTITYSLVNEDGSAYTAGEFVIGSSNGVVTVGGAIDREAGATRTLHIRAVSADGSSATSSFTVNVGDVNEFAPVFTSGALGSVTENAATSVVIYQAAATDADATAALGYSLSGTDAALLNIDASTGAVTLKNAANFEAKPSYSFNVVASDGANSTTQAVVVSVANVNEPLSGTLAVVGVAALNQTLSVQSTLNDPDGMGALSYQWLADGEPIVGATSAELLLSSALVGKAISAQVSYLDGTGALVTVDSVGATDKVNAVDPTQEAEVPGLPDGDGNTVSGDGNGDGIADAQQDAVASIAATLPSSGGGTPTPTYLSLVATDTAAPGEGSTANTGAVITSFQQTDAPDDLPANASMPLGGISFTAQAVDGGGSGETLAVPETFSLYVDKDLDINGFWVTGTDGVLYNLASAVNGGQIVEEGGKLRVDFTIPEGSDLYADMVQDGVLTVTGALGHVDEGISGVVPAPTTTAFWF